MAKGDRYPAEWNSYTDLRTGGRIQQLTNYRGNSCHLYFTNPGWYAGGRKLLFVSDRNNQSDLFGIDLETGEIQQLTDLSQSPPPAETVLTQTSKSPTREEVYFWYDRDLVALDLVTLDQRVLHRLPREYRQGITNVTADGRFVCSLLVENLSEKFSGSIHPGGIGAAECRRQFADAKPRSQVIRVDVNNGSVDVVLEDNRWLDHVNTSPTIPHLLTYCHSSPFIEQRIWCLDLNTGETWKVRPQTTGERITHEYWHGDGQRIGYHGRTEQGTAFLGSIRYDNSEQVEARLDRETMHTHSNGMDLVVGDGTRARPQLLLWRYTGETWDGPRDLHTHRCSSHVQKVHVHPRFSPDGKQILFTSNQPIGCFPDRGGGYGNVYLIEVKEFDALPEAAQ